MSPEDVIAKITTYAESLGISSPEVNISNHWSDGAGEVKIQTGPVYGDSWASHGYRLPRCSNLETIEPVIVQAGKDAADHLLQFVATKQ